MASLNKVMLIGNVGRIEVRTFQDGKVVNASLAVSERYTKRDGTQVEDTTWFNLVINGKLADVFDKYVQKGDRLYVEGRCRQRSYQTREGEYKYIWEVVVMQMQMLSAKKEDDANAAAPAPASDDLPEDFS